MVALNKIVQEIESLPKEYFQEIMGAEEWDTPKKDEAWADLYTVRGKIDGIY